MIYSAITDRTTRSKPTLPNISAGAGTHFTDPTFGSRMLRLTDANTRPDRVNRFWSTPSGSETCAWNADNTRFWILGGGGEQLLYSFNAAALSATRLGDTGDASGGHVLLLLGEPEFSFTDPDLLYGQSSGFSDRIAQYRLSTLTETTLHDIQTKLPGVVSHPVGMSTSVSPLRFCMGLGGSTQDTDIYVYVWDPSLGARWLNTSTGQIGGDWGSTGAYTGSSGFTIHNVRISRNGRWIRLTPIGSSGQMIWDITTKTLTSHTDWGGHVALGYDQFLIQSGVTDAMNTRVYNLAAATEFTVPTTLRSPPLADSEGHVCWNAVQSDELQPFVTEVWKTAGTIAGPWDEEIIAIGVDSAYRDTVWRFCHHRTQIVGGFSEQPRPNVSRDGRVALFTSNWENTLGTGRTDVFAVELAQPGLNKKRTAAFVEAAR